MHVGNLLQHVEHAPDAVADAARQKQHEPRKRKAGDKRGKETPRHTIQAAGR